MKKWLCPYLMRVVRGTRKWGIKQCFSLLWSATLATVFLYALLYSKVRADDYRAPVRQGTLKQKALVCSVALKSSDEEEPGMGDVVTIKPDKEEPKPEIDPRTIPQPELPLQIVPTHSPTQKKTPLLPPVDPKVFPPLPKKPTNPKWNIN